jgi:hypothetical protein
MTRPLFSRSEDITTWRSHVAGPRWAKFGKALRDRIWADPRLELVACEDEQGLLRTTTRFEVRGPTAAVEALQLDLLDAVESWNAR